MHSMYVCFLIALCLGDVLAVWSEEKMAGKHEDLGIGTKFSDTCLCKAAESISLHVAGPDVPLR